MKTKSFLGTTLLGGLAAILPLALIILLIKWGIGIIEKYLAPLVHLFKPSNDLATIVTYMIIASVILALFFFMGLFIETRFGDMIRNYFERNYLMKIPGYKTMKDVVMQFFGNKRSFFSDVVLVDIYKTGNLMTGFITDETKEYITVFVPTGPNPTTGFIFHVLPENIIRSSVAVETAMKSIISCGAGSADVILKMDKSEALRKKP